MKMLKKILAVAFVVFCANGIWAMQESNQNLTQVNWKEVDDVASNAPDNTTNVREQWAKKLMFLRSLAPTKNQQIKHQINTKLLEAKVAYNVAKQNQNNN